MREERAREDREETVWERFEREREPVPDLTVGTDQEREEQAVEETPEKVPAGVGS